MDKKLYKNLFKIFLIQQSSFACLFTILLIIIFSINGGFILFKLVLIFSLVLLYGLIIQGILRLLIWFEKNIRRVWNQNTPPYHNFRNKPILNFKSAFDENTFILIQKSRKFSLYLLYYYIILFFSLAIITFLNQEQYFVSLFRDYVSSLPQGLISSISSYPILLLFSFIRNIGISNLQISWKIILIITIIVIPLIFSSIIMANISRYVSIKFLEIFSKYNEYNKKIHKQFLFFLFIISLVITNLILISNIANYIGII